jgi:hypothetical protein
MDSNFIVSISAIFIALASLAVTIWQGIITRKHNILSVKPIPDILISNFENKIAVTLENKGTGALIIKSFRAYCGNESKSNIIDWMPILDDGIYWSNWLRDFEGSALKPLESKVLLEFTLDDHDKKQTEARDIIRKSLSKISIEIEYTDIYNTKMFFPLHFLSSTFGKYYK